MEKIINFINILWFLLLLFIIANIVFIKFTWGFVDITQILFFTNFNCLDAVNTELIYSYIVKCVIFPIFLFFLILYILKKSSLYNFFINFKVGSVIILVLFTLMFCWGKCLNLNNFFEFNKGNDVSFYEKNYKEVNLNNDEKRNVIIIFAESFDEKYSHYEDIKVNDDDAIKFDNFIEGYAQRWTQGALFSALTGTHIHYLSSIFLYTIKYRGSSLANKYGIIYGDIMNDLGDKFDFYTPKINSLGKIAKNNGYQNLFIQGTSINFSGTKKFLLNNGFDWKNVYGFDELVSVGYQPVNKKGMAQSILDKDVYDAFKKKINNLDKTKPFFAIMFTYDLHVSQNENIEKNIDNMAKFSIYNLNDFIKWFKAQDFYHNTTLVVLGDHNRMGKNVSTGNKIYNAFFNVPDKLKKNINLKRTFNQIDIFPTILEIMGNELKDGGAGLGISLFSDKKTVAEKYSYGEQDKILNSKDIFYYNLWQVDDKEKQFRNSGLYEKVIAHAGEGIDGNIYTNSLEAVNESMKRGYKYIELDLYETNDNPKRIVAYHNCDDFNKYVIKKSNCLDIRIDDLCNRDKNSKYTPLYDENILEFFWEHENLWLVTDKIDNFELLERVFEKIKRRMVVEVFSYKKYQEAIVKGFAKVAYNIKNEQDIELVKNKRIKMVTIYLDFAKQHINDLKMLKNKGVEILGFTAKNFDEIASSEEYIDMFYYDGEESLNEFNR